MGQTYLTTQSYEVLGALKVITKIKALSGSIPRDDEGGDLGLVKMYGVP